MSEKPMQIQQAMSPMAPVNMNMVHSPGNMQGIQEDSPQGRTNATVHVRENSNSDLERLFSVLQSTDISSDSKPWNDRILPKSFFTPPTGHRGGHNREGSADAATAFGQSQVPLIVSHSRSHSSPAQLPHSLSIAQPSQHPRQASLGDFTQDDLDLTPFPPGWEVAKTAEGQRYFINHRTQKTQWDDPRLHMPSPQKQLSQGSLLSNSASSLVSAPTPPLQHVAGPVLVDTNTAAVPVAPGTAVLQVTPPSGAGLSLGPLPTGWDEAITPSEEVYFMNHNDRKTSWFDPRIPKDDQKPGMKIHELQQLRANFIRQQQQQASPQQAKLAVPAAGGLPVVQPPALSPVPMQQAQQQQQQQQHPARRPPSPHIQMAGGLMHQAVPQQELQRVRRMQEELRQKQVQLDRRENAIQEILQAQLSPVSVGSTGPLNALPVVAPPGAAGVVQDVGDDPILGQAGGPTGANNVDSHARQNSTDSGLGGMGTNYSLPRTPEDFLSNVEEMDAQDGGHKLGTAATTDFNLNDIEPGMQMDTAIGGGDPGDTTTMDGDDLMPSIQDEIGTNFLGNGQTVESLLTWL